MPPSFHRPSAPASVALPLVVQDHVLPEVEIASNIIISAFHTIFHRHSPPPVAPRRMSPTPQRQGLFCSPVLPHLFLFSCYLYRPLGGWLLMPRIWLCPLSGTRINGRLYFRAAFALFQAPRRGRSVVVVVVVVLVAALVAVEWTLPRCCPSIGGRRVAVPSSSPTIR